MYIGEEENMISLLTVTKALLPDFSTLNNIIIIFQVVNIHSII